eukprot:jgi/Tetstr1/422549/TSEL_013357.t1
MADFKDQVATYEGGQVLRFADDLSYEPEIDMIVSYLTYMDARHGNIDGSHRREAKRMVRFNYPETYWDNKGICFKSDKMYIGMSPEVCRYMSMKLNEAGHTVVGDTSMHKLLASTYYATPNLYELVQDVKDAGDDDSMAVTHTNAEWLAKIETMRFRDLLRRASIKLMNAIDTAKSRKPIDMMTPDKSARTWGEYLSDHIIDHDVSADVSDEQAAARLEALTMFRAKVDDLGPSGFPKKFQDLFKGFHRSGPLMVLMTRPKRWEVINSADCLTPTPAREHIAATNTSIKSQAFQIKNQMPDLVISFFTEFALLACAPLLLASSAPGFSEERWISMKVK